MNWQLCIMKPFGSKFYFPQRSQLVPWEVETYVFYFHRPETSWPDYVDLVLFFHRGSTNAHLCKSWMICPWWYLNFCEVFFCRSPKENRPPPPFLNFIFSLGLLLMGKTHPSSPRATHGRGALRAKAYEVASSPYLHPQTVKSQECGSSV